MGKSLAHAASLVLMALSLAGAARAQDNAQSGPAVPAEADATPLKAPSPAPWRAAARPSAAVAAAPRLLPREDRRFLSEAAAASRFEIDAAKLAIAKTTNPKVKALAQDALSHHTLAYTQLVKHSHYRAMAPPMLANDQRKTLNRLAKLTGAKFDRDYLQAAGIEGHRDYTKLLERSSREVKDPQLRLWVEQNLPATQQQQALAEAVLAPRVAGAVRPARIVNVSGSR